MDPPKSPSPADQAKSAGEPHITGFASQKLMGYQCDARGTFKVKVYKAEVMMSDGSTRVIYATISMENFEKGEDLHWDWQNTNHPPVIHRNNLGIWVVDPKTVLK